MASQEDHSLQGLLVIITGKYRDSVFVTTRYVVLKDQPFLCRLAEIA